MKKMISGELSSSFGVGKISLFLKGDVKNVIRDPLMFLVLTIPIYMYLLIKFGLPFVDLQIARFSTFQLMDHLIVIMALIFAMTPMMVGMLTGFLLLDEKDDGIFSYMEITPMKKAGYLAYRITIPTILSCFITIVMALFLLSGVGVDWTKLIFSLVLASLYGPLTTMYLASFSQNKVEGLAYAKLINILMIAPVVAYLFDGWWTAAAYVIPLTWGIELLFGAMAGSYFGVVSNWFGLFAGGIATTGVWLILFYRKLQKSL